jgi:hypothetical protein
MSVTRSLFNSEWIDKTLNPDFSSWIQAVPNNRFLARCRVCMKNFTLSNMGRAAVSSHMKSSLHVRKMEASKTCHTITSLVSVKSQPQEQQSINDPSTSCITASVHSDVPREVKEINVNSTDKPTDKLDSFLVKTTVTNSEIIWALKVVMNHLSFRSCKDLGETFRTMFPDSAIAKQFTLSAAKVAYTIVHGLAPYFAEKLVSSINECAFYVACFDEALNKIAQRGKMDIVIRYWDRESNMVATRYLTSVFLGHASARDLEDKFKQGLSELNMDRLAQISMDGPNSYSDQGLSSML